MRKLIIVTVALFLLISVYADAEIYKYVDEKGTVVFTDDLSKVPKDQKPNVKEYKSNKKNINSSTEDKRENVQRYNSEETTSNKSISDKQSEEQFKEMMKKAIEEEYGIEVKESCPEETEADIYQAIKSTWEAMSQMMIAGDIDKALTYFSPFSREQNRRKMSDLSNEDLKGIFGSFEKIEIYTLYKEDGIANCGVIRKEKSGTFSYAVRFLKDPDCTWRISGM